MVPVDPRVSAGHLDKVVHLCEYLFFAWLLVQAIRGSRTAEREHLVWAWIYATSYGLLIELLQGMVPWRSADLTDAMANGLGAALGVWLGARQGARG
jgi:VanZ family protein